MAPRYLLVGQGLSGTLLSWFLYREGIPFLLIDEARPHTASHTAAGVINPVTGRRYHQSWMIDTIMPFAISTYHEMEQALQTKLVHEKTIIDFFPTPEARNLFVEKIGAGEAYLHAYPEQNDFNPYFQYEFGCGEIRPAYAIHVARLLSTWRNQLQEKGLLREEAFDTAALEVNRDGARYADLSVEKIIFCEGTAALANPWFERLPFAPNKGEALVVELEGPLYGHIYKKGMMLVPLPEENQYWLGSNFRWDTEDPSPTETFLLQAKALLDRWVKPSYRILEQRAAIRPATVERRPFVGLHPQQQAVGILNGMGTKGTSLAPFFANGLVQHLVQGLPLAVEADVRRFARILSR
jgi:glycine/D-amino acid oxidase-like deaminating enzyme